MSNVSAIIFDLDGTIVLSHPVHFEAYRQVFADFDIPFSYDEFNAIFAGIGATKIITTILKKAGADEVFQDYYALKTYVTNYAILSLP